MMLVVGLTFHSVPYNKILDVTKLKAFADHKFNNTKMTIYLFDKVENTVGKGENTGCVVKSSSRNPKF